MENRKLISEFECTVCLDVPHKNSKIFQCNRGHLVCQECHDRLQLCPTCKKKLGDIRCLVAEKCLRQLSTIETGELDELQTKFRNMKRRHELEMKQFNFQLKLLRNKMRHIKVESKQGYYMSDENGFIQVYVVVGGEKCRSAIYWGQNKGDINESYKAHGYTNFNDNSVEATVRAIEMAEELGIQKLAVNICETTPSYDYIINLETWKKRNWIDKNSSDNDQRITYAHDLELLDTALQDSSNIEIKFIGTSEDNEEIKRAMQLRDLPFTISYV